jgi:hypothetical protein
MADDNGFLMPPYNHHSVSTLDPNGYSAVFTKNNLLDLSDPKYATTRNAIAGLGDRTSSNLRQFADTFVLKVLVNSSNNYQIIGTMFNPILTKKIEWVTFLPDQFILNKLGKLVVNPSELSNPPDNPGYSVVTGTLNRTNNDDSVELLTVTVYIVKENFDQNDVPEDDPVIPLLLQNTCSQPAGCFTVGTAIFCSDACSWQGFCCSNCAGAGKNFFACFCAETCP